MVKNVKNERVLTPGHLKSEEPEGQPCWRGLVELSTSGARCMVEYLADRGLAGASTTLLLTSLRMTREQQSSADSQVADSQGAGETVISRRMLTDCGHGHNEILLLNIEPILCVLVVTRNDLDGIPRQKRRTSLSIVAQPDTQPFHSLTSWHVSLRN